MSENSSYLGSNTDEFENDDAQYGIPSACFCGGRAKLGPSLTGENPGRLIYTCQENDDGGCHISKWGDQAVMEELRSLRQEIHEYPNKMRQTLLLHRDEIVHLDGQQTYYDSEFVRLKSLIAKKNDAIAMALKTAVVAAFVVLAAVMYLNRFRKI